MKFYLQDSHFLYVILQIILLFSSSTFGYLLDNGNCLTKCLIPIDVDIKCGSNGVTYQNIEELNCAKQLCFPDLTLAYDGKCAPKSPNDQQPTTTTESKNPKPSIKPNPNLIVTESSYQNTKSRTTTVKSTVRPTSAVPYPAIHFKVEPSVPKRKSSSNNYSKNQNNGNNNAKTKADACNPDDCVCDYTLSPICGTNGVTYGNICILQCVKECNPELAYHHAGFCGKIFFPSLDRIPFFRVLKPGDRLIG